MLVSQSVVLSGNVEAVTFPFLFHVSSECMDLFGGIKAAMSVLRETDLDRLKMIQNVIQVCMTLIDCLIAFLIHHRRVSYSPSWSHTADSYVAVFFVAGLARLSLSLCLSVFLTLFETITWIVSLGFCCL
jgi:hypothetical protein